ALPAVLATLPTTSQNPISAPYFFSAHSLHKPGCLTPLPHKGQLIAVDSLGILINFFLSLFPTNISKNPIPSPFMNV
ncbi:MAG: hypothetical protein MSA79_07590, partial [Campylobacter sp.]|nr:hypothetical protein [Campylobacter sp.]